MTDWSEKWDKKERKGNFFGGFATKKKDHIHNFIVKKDGVRCKECNKTREDVRRTEW